MSKKSIKKSKAKPVFKATIWMNTAMVNDSLDWQIENAEIVLQSYDEKKTWKGKLTLYQTCLIVKSKTKTIVKTFDYVDIKGLLASPFNNKMLVIGVLYEGLTYLIIRCENNNDKDRIFNEISKTFNNSQTMLTNISNDDLEYINNQGTSSSAYVMELPTVNSHMYMNEELDQPTIEELKTSFVSKIPKTFIVEENMYKSLPRTIIDEGKYNNMEKTIPKNLIYENNFSINSNQSTAKFINFETNLNGINNDYESADEDDDPMWIEDTKYIDYVPSLGRNIESENGSIYMYCAYQLLPIQNGFDKYYSDEF